MDKSILLNTLGKYKVQLSILLVFLVLWAMFFIGNSQVFSNPRAYASLMATTSFIIILGLGLTFVITVKEIDLSFPAVMALSSWLFVSVWVSSGNLILAMLSGLGGGFIAGLVNGVLVTKARVPSLIGTLGMLFFWRGFIMVGAKGRGASLFALEGTTFQEVLVGRIGEVIPMQMIWAIVLVFIFWLILNRHKFGSHILFTGDNSESARMMGVNVDRVKILAFTIMGIMAAFAGILICLEVSSFWPGMGDGYLLLAIAAVILGGTSLFGGVGTIFGTLIGTLIIGWLETGILASGLTGFWVKLIYGLVIVLGVIVHEYLRRR